MSIFISWSGDESRRVAEALKEWLPSIFPSLDVFMSHHDIQAGARWDSGLSEQLAASNFGIICLTADNLKAPWLTFEAGALSKSIRESRVVPYRIGLQASDVAPPLSQFQGVDANEDGTLKLIISLNDALDRVWPTDEKLRNTFNHCWPDLMTVLDELPDAAKRKIRSDRELLEEILEIVRQSGIRDLNNQLGRLLVIRNVRRVEVAPKEVGGQVVGTLALRITVERKLPPAEIPADQLIPSSIFGMPTDVVEAD